MNTTEMDTNNHDLVDKFLSISNGKNRDTRQSGGGDYDLVDKFLHTKRDRHTDSDRKRITGK
jgi:hypothetical protein